MVLFVVAVLGGWGSAITFGAYAAKLQIRTITLLTVSTVSNTVSITARVTRRCKIILFVVAVLGSWGKRDHLWRTKLHTSNLCAFQGRLERQKTRRTDIRMHIRQPRQG